MGFWAPIFLITDKFQRKPHNQDCGVNSHNVVQKQASTLLSFGYGAHFWRHVTRFHGNSWHGNQEKCVFSKINPKFILIDCCNFWYNFHCFRIMVNVLFILRKFGHVTEFATSGCHGNESDGRFQQPDPDFLLVVKGNFSLLSFLSKSWFFYNGSSLTHFLGPSIQND